MRYRRLLVVDPSLSCSGWALFDISSKTLQGVGSIKTLGAEFPLATRLKNLQKNIQTLFEQIGLSDQDVCICEDATSIKDPSAAAKVEQVRGIFETLSRIKGVCVPGRLHPRTVHYELMGLKGKQFSRDLVKASAVRTVQQLFSAELKKINFSSSEENLQKSQDIVDALLLGSVSLNKIHNALHSEMELEYIFDSGSKTRLQKRASYS